jgi:VIT1/CCC1 family predicted Fe2+/Mn2+ transporter
MITGSTSAKVGGASVGKAMVRVVFGGAVAMIVTYAIGAFFGVRGT